MAAFEVADLGTRGKHLSQRKCFSMYRISFAVPGRGRKRLYTACLFSLLCLGIGVFLAFTQKYSAAQGGRTSWLPFSSSLTLSTPSKEETGKTPNTSEDPEKAAVDMLTQRFNALLKGDFSGLEKNYLTQELSGEYGVERERKRVDYMKEWLSAREVVLTEASATFEIDSVEKEGDDTVWLEITEHAVYAYEYPGTQGHPPCVHRFGSRTVHVLELRKDQGRWKIARDWYTDPLGNDAWDAPAVGIVEDSGLQSVSVPRETIPIEDITKNQQYDRSKAVDYAKRYSGVRSLPDGGRYNPKFKVYTFLGGDCANFASQVLEAGGIDQGGGWYYAGEGSTAWVQGESLVWHLLSSGKAVLLFRGSYGDAVKPRDDFPAGYIGALEPGDIIAYETGGQICHVAVVVGKDPKSYVTIASHTADRLYFPWDMGWDKTTVFWLIKVVW